MIALSNLGPESTALMVQALQDTHDDVRFMAVSGLGAATGIAQKIVRLAKVVTDPSPNVPRFGNVIVKNVDTPEAREALKNPWRRKETSALDMALRRSSLGRCRTH